MQKAWIRGRKKIYLEKYAFSSAKIQCESGKIRVHVISDFHGDLNEREIDFLVREMKKRKPDLVMLTGDCIAKKNPATFHVAKKLIKELCENFTVVYAPGNHETYVERVLEQKEQMEAYWDDCTKLGVIVLRNTFCEIRIRGTKVNIQGLELGLEYYKRFQKRRQTIPPLSSFIGDTSRDGYQILMAHHPKYGDSYFDWGEDLILSGHYHGGCIRLGKHCGLISPGFELFPRYCCGDFRRKSAHMVVSAGLGEHTIPFRIFNPRVLLEIDLLPIEKKQDI